MAVTVTGYLSLPEDDSKELKVLQGAFVRLVDNGNAATFDSTVATDASGYFAIAGVPASVYTLWSKRTAVSPWIVSSNTSFVVSDPFAIVPPAVANITGLGPGQVPIGTAGAPVARALVNADVGTVAGDLAARAPLGADCPVLGADPTGVADATALIAAAINKALAAPGGGDATLPAGTFLVTAPLPSISKLNVVLRGAGISKTFIKYTGSGTCIKVQVNPPTNHPAAPAASNRAGGITGLSIDGTGAAAGTNGIEYGDIVGGELDVNVQNFPGIGVWFHNVNGFSERNRCRVSALYCTTDVQWNDSGGQTTSFSYNEYDFYFENGGTQTCMHFASGSIIAGKLNAQANLTGTATFILADGYVNVMDMAVNLRAEAALAGPVFANIVAPNTIWRCYGIVIPGAQGGAPLLPVNGAFAGSYDGLNYGGSRGNDDIEHVIQGPGRGIGKTRLRIQNGGGGSTQAGMYQTTGSKLVIENGGDVVEFDGATHASNFHAQIYPSTPIGGTQTLVGFFGGSAAPVNANGNNGDIYFRSDGATQATIYQRRVGVWVEVTAALASDAAVVHNAGAEAVAGVKTFSSAPVVPVASFPESAIANLITDLAAKAPLLNPTFTNNLTVAGSTLAGGGVTTNAGGNLVMGDTTCVMGWAAGGIAIRNGSGVPSNASGSNNDIYLRTDGVAGGAIYQKRAGVWVEVMAGLAPLTDPRFTQVAASAQAASYTLVLADAGTVVEMNVAGANTLTVPPNAAVAFPIGTILEVFQLGAGQCTITPGAAVVFRSDGAKTKTAAQYASVSLRKRATDEWVLAGDLTT